MAAQLGVGEYIWYDTGDDRFQVPIGGQITDRKGRIIEFKDDHGKKHRIDVGTDLGKVKIMHPSSVKGVADMILLGDLNESGILRNLHVRYKQNTIYTYTGTILVAVNPYKIIPGLYEQNQIEAYTNKRIGEKPPHVFAITDNAYTGMMRNKMSQCVVVSGESGSGKTESTKLMLQYLAAASGQHSAIEQQILESNPILEAFGNARTLRNDNSSRFGKYIDIQFTPSGQIECARIDEYLLEKSRLISQQSGERNFHIFYMMLSGLSGDTRQKLGLKMSASEYSMTKVGANLKLDGWNDREEFSKVAAAMRILNFKENEYSRIFELLAALLHYSNIQLQETVVDNNDATAVKNNSALEHAARLLGASTDTLKLQLTEQTLAMRGETVKSILNISKSRDTLDAFIKGVYGRLFSWIVDKVNSAVGKSKKRKNDPFGGKSIGLLDIFGFEKFEKNSFEQLCINFANEKLQQFFVHHIFKLEQEEYTREGIKWDKISFVDNQNILDLIAMKPMNLFALIDEEAFYPRGTDITLLEKLRNKHQGSRIFAASTNSRDQLFTVIHFAGDVTYNTGGFLEKNRDTFHADSLSLVENSSNKFLAFLFKSEIRAKSSGTGNKRPKTLLKQFTKSMDELMKTLTSCEPFFVRCIKPNETKSAMVFDRQLVHRQLMYSGMLETITIRKAGYPIRYDFDYFTGRYDVCCGNLRHNPNFTPREKCREILSKVLPKEDWKVGHTKVFMKGSCYHYYTAKCITTDGQEVQMERAREEALLKYIITIQRSTRGWLRRRRVKRLNATILMIQTLTRAAQARVAYNQMKVGYARLQAVWKAHKLQYKYNKIRNFIIRLQARSRGYLIRSSRFKRNDAVVIIQSYVRGLLARRYHKREMQKNEIQKLPKSEQKKRMAEFDAEEKKQLAALLANKRRLKEAQKNDQKDIEEIDNMFKDIENGVGDFDDLDDGNIEYIEDADHGVGNQQGAFSDDLSAYTFMKYATTYFTSAVSHTHLRRPLKEPLLHHDDEVDRSASLSIWITILRFMLDMSEPRNTTTTDSRPESTIIRLQRIIGRAQKTKAKAMMETQKGRKTRIYSAADGFREFTDNRTTHLTKIQFIIGMGIIRPELRDEIFCQICKQLTQNRNRQGAQRGWMLMALCVGCFGPSEKFEKYLRCFLRENQPRHYQYYEGKLNRTLKNGVRQWPPNTVEIRAARNRKQIQVRVSLMDKTVHQVKADSATTAKEVCQEIASLAGLDEGTYGFGLFISIFQRVSSLGGGREHLMDAIAQCEQISVEQSLAAESAPWQIILRKEVFSPWYNPMVDLRASQLIRKQIISSLSYGEFPNVNDMKLANLAAQELTIQCGATWNADKAAKVVREIVPEAKRKAEGPEAWNQKVKAALEKLKKENQLWKTSSISSEQVQAHMLRQCRKDFTLPFSRFFQIRPVSRDAKFLSSEGTDMLIAVNWMGVFIVTTTESILAKIRFSEIRQIELIRNVRDVPYGFTLETIQEKSFQFICSACEDIDEIVNTFVEGLRARSQFAVGKTDLAQHMVQEGDLAFARGDLIILDQVAGKALLGENEAHGRNDRTGFSGTIRAENVWVVPTLLKPDEELVKLFKMTDVELERLNRKTMSAAQMEQTESSAKYYTLQEYAQDFFRNESKGKSSRGVIAFDKSKSQASWAKSTQPITQPLLIKTPDYLTSDAGHMFLAILKYCGDHPAGRTVNITDKTDPIFNLPLKKKELRDECYCQIMKQLTRNPKKASEEKAWKLFWLLCGLMPPSAQLYPHVSRFLSSRNENTMAMECSQRLYRVNRNGARRMPPHSTEVEAIENETTQIYHFIHLGPSQELKEVFALDSSMRAGDLVSQIAKRLRMKSHEGFSLFIFIADKMIAIKDDQFFFDVIRELSDALSRSGQSAADYKVHFMRKLWISFIPGKDAVSDKLFNFPQESKKYLRGFYDVDQKKAAELGAYLYIAFFDESPLNRQALKKGQITTELVPQNSKFSMDKARKDIEKQLSNLAGVSPDDAKFKFLKVLVEFPNFGSTFVECRQFGDSTLPEKIILAIHKRGITVLDPVSKAELMRKGYSEITNWSFGETYFSMSFGNLINGSKLICETTQGYKMENLVSSYIKQLEKTIKKTNAKTKSTL